nr:PAS domain S-box protein [Chloroflexota bacterium]
MTLWEKTLRLIGIIVLVLIAALFAVQRLVVLRHFSEMEQQEVQRGVAQALNSFAHELIHLDWLVQDWAYWDDTYRFVLDGNEEYIQANLVDQTFFDSRINLILIADTSARIVFAKAFDLDREEEISIPEFAQDKLYPGHPLLDHRDTTSSKVGILQLSIGPMLVASRPILTSKNEGPIRGSFIMGRLVDKEILSHISDILQFPLQFLPSQEMTAPAKAQGVPIHILGSIPVWVQVLDANSVAGYALVNDLYGQPALLLRIEQPRDTYHSAQRSFNPLAVVLSVGGLLFFAVVILLLETNVLTPIQELSRRVQQIGERGELSARVPVTSEDEIGQLAQGINVMLSGLQQTTEAVRQREKYLEALAEAGQILLALSPDLPYEPFLETLGKAVGASRAYIFLLHRDAQGRLFATQKAEWCAEGITPQIDNPMLQNLDVVVHGLQRIVDILSRGEVINSLVADLPPQERLLLEAQNIKAFLILPLLMDHALIGFMGFDRCDEARTWSQAEADLFRTAAADLTQALRHRRDEQVQHAIYRIAEAIHHVRDLVELFQEVHCIVGELMPANNFYIALYDHATETLHFPYFVDEYDQPPAPKKLGKGLTEYVLRTGEPLLAPPGVFEELMRRGEVESVGAPSIDWLGVPLKAQDRVIGVLAVQSYTEGIRYGQEDKELLQFVSEQIALAIERKRTEQELQERERRFRSLLDNVELVAVGLDKEGHVTYANPYLLQLTGYSLDEVLGKNWFATFIPERHRQTLGTMFAELLQDWRYLHHENPILTKSGEERLIVWNNTLLLDTEGNPIGTMSIGEDITERRRMEQALLESEERYRTIFETNATANVIIEEDTIISLVNKRVEQLFGYAKEEVEGKMSWTEFIAPEDVPRLLEYHRLRRQDPSAAPSSYECRGVDRTGKRIDLLVNVAIIPGTKRSVASLLDLTARKRMEEDLRRLKEFNEGIVRSMAEGLLLEDANGIISFVNPALEELLGYTAEELIGWHWRKIVPLEEMAKIEAQVAQRPQGISSMYEAQLLRKDGSRVPVLISARPLFEKDVFVGVLTAFTDLTALKKADEERRKLEEQLRQAQKMEAVGLLAGGVAHEFNNLLTVVQGNAELAMSELAPSDPLYARLSSMREAAQRGARLTQQLLAFSRRQILQPRPLDLNALVRNFAAMIGRLIGADVALQLDLAPDLKPVFSDPGALEQVLMNLAMNARDAMPEGGTLRIETAPMICDEAYCQAHPEATPGEYVRLTIADTGRGMNEEIKAHLFEPFFTTKEIGKGTGLGLSMVYGIVKEHGGFIEVWSEVGQGTRFDIYQPVAQLADPAPKAQE